MRQRLFTPPGLIQSRSLLPDCTVADTVTVIVTNCANSFYMPGAFTPNGDGHNDIIKPTVQGDVEIYTFSIFNRFGQQVFTSQSPNSGWDGRFKGIPQQTGGYVWFCSYKFKNSQSQLKKGTFVLIR